MSVYGVQAHATSGLYQVIIVSSKSELDEQYHLEMSYLQLSTVFCSSHMTSHKEIIPPEMLLPTCPDLKLLRELTVSPYLRSQIDTESVGTVRITVNTTISGFENFGVQM